MLRLRERLDPAKKPAEWTGIESVRIFVSERVTMTHSSVGGSADVEVYASWALILVRMTHALVGADPSTIFQNKIHPAVAEPEFTPLDLSYISRIERKG